MSKNLKIEDWYNLYCDNNIKHSDIIEDIYKKLIYFINHNKFILDFLMKKNLKANLYIFYINIQLKLSINIFNFLYLI